MLQSGIKPVNQQQHEDFRDDDDKSNDNSEFWYFDTGDQFLI